jgi:hypothetical protein
MGEESTKSGSLDANDEKSGLAAWHAVQDLNLVQELAASPYDVLVYLYPKAVGLFDPCRHQAWTV